jgi:hypothetical protein
VCFKFIWSPRFWFGAALISKSVLLCAQIQPEAAIPLSTRLVESTTFIALTAGQKMTGEMNDKSTLVPQQEFRANRKRMSPDIPVPCSKKLATGKSQTELPALPPNPRTNGEHCEEILAPTAAAKIWFGLRAYEDCQKHFHRCRYWRSTGLPTRRTVGIFRFTPGQRPALLSGKEF